MLCRGLDTSRMSNNLGSRKDLLWLIELAMEEQLAEGVIVVIRKVVG